MKSVRSVYKIGHGPSSSHTVGPYNAALRFGQRHPDADHFRVTLYGSLAFTGAGHGTGKAILSGLPARRQNASGLDPAAGRRRLPEYLSTLWQAMQAAIQRGLPAEGILPGGLEVERKAKILYEKRCYNESADVTMNRVIAAYAYAVSEENASENIVVTAPTCGSCGVIPAVLYYMEHERGFPEEEIIGVTGWRRKQLG